MLEVFQYSVKAVATIIIAALPGFLLVKFRILSGDALRALGKVIVYAALPALLATKLMKTIDIDSISHLWIFPVSGIIFIFGGYFAARFANLFIKDKSELKGVLYTASALGNAAYLPIPLIIAICSLFPEFRDDSGAAERGITYISAFLIAFSPLSWIFGYNTISDKDHKFELKYFFPPPVIGILAGILIGLTPPLKKLLCFPESPLFPLYEALKIIATATIPGAMIVLGGRFALPPEGSTVSRRVISTVAVIKLLVLPAAAIGYIFLLRHLGIISGDPMIALILIVEAAVPPANNLILMASMHKINEYATAKTLFVCYLISTVTLTLFIALAIRIFAG